MSWKMNENLSKIKCILRCFQEYYWKNMSIQCIENECEKLNKNQLILKCFREYYSKI